jgi:hypothetical protein
MIVGKIHILKQLFAIDAFQRFRNMWISSASTAAIAAASASEIDLSSPTGGSEGFGGSLAITRVD